VDPFGLWASREGFCHFYHPARGGLPKHARCFGGDRCDAAGSGNCAPLPSRCGAAARKPFLLSPGAELVAMATHLHSDYSALRATPPLCAIIREQLPRPAFQAVAFSSCCLARVPSRVLCRHQEAEVPAIHEPAWRGPKVPA